MGVRTGRTLQATSEPMMEPKVLSVHILKTAKIYVVMYMFELMQELSS